MNCVELQNSLAEVEDGSTVEQRAHLMDCPACFTLVKELDLIIEAAGRLQEADEPSPRVWTSIAAQLRQEGLIRPQRGARPPLSSFSSRWGAARWLVPAAAMLLLALGLYVRQQPATQKMAQQIPVMAPQVNVRASDLSDDDLLQEVADNTPAMRGQYEDNLRRVNESIREAQGFVDESPNDEDARRSLMDAYQQKSMLFEMAMDRPLQ
jgi:Anti-sigma-K factor rskA